MSKVAALPERGAVVVPLRDYVYLAENKTENVTESGIVVEGRLGESKSGTVLAVGPCVKDIVVGDVVFPMWNKIQIIQIDGVQRAVIKEEEIVAKVENY